MISMIPYTGKNDSADWKYVSGQRIFVFFCKNSENIYDKHSKLPAKGNRLTNSKINQQSIKTLQQFTFSAKYQVPAYWLK